MHRGCRNQWRALVAVLATSFVLAASGCEGGSEPAPPASTVDAFPDPPHVVGPLTVRLRPALALVTGDRRCRPAPDSGRLCSPDGSGGYQALGNSGPVVVDEVTTTPSADHTSWRTTVRFAAGSHDGVRRVRRQAIGIGGVVVVTVKGTVLMVVAPIELTPRRIARLGLEKAEAWGLVETFSRSKQRM